MRFSRFSLLAELWRYVRETGKISFFLLMLFIFFLGLIIIASENAAVMPFIYTLF